MSVKLVGTVAAVGTSLSLLLAGCGGSDHPTAAASTTTSSSVASSAAPSSAAPSTSPATSSPPPTTAAAPSAPASAIAQRFVAIVTPINASLSTFLSLAETTPIAQVHAAASKVVADETALIAQLKQTRWPAAARQRVATLITAAEAELKVYRGITTAPSTTVIANSITNAKDVLIARAQASAEVRVALGLPATTASSQPAPSATSTTSA